MIRQKFQTGSSLMQDRSLTSSASQCLFNPTLLSSILLPYLNILGEEIIGKYVKRAEITNLIELEDHLHKVVWEGVVSPSHPAVTCSQETKY
jgi:hypothetical protein